MRFSASRTQSSTNGLPLSSRYAPCAHTNQSVSRSFSLVAHTGPLRSHTARHPRVVPSSRPARPTASSSAKPFDTHHAEIHLLRMRIRHEHLRDAQNRILRRLRNIGESSAHGGRRERSSPSPPSLARARRARPSNDPSRVSRERSREHARPSEGYDDRVVSRSFATFTNDAARAGVARCDASTSASATASASAAAPGCLALFRARHTSTCGRSQYVHKTHCASSLCIRIPALNFLSVTWSDAWKIDRRD